MSKFPFLLSVAFVFIFSNSGWSRSNQIELKLKQPIEDSIKVKGENRYSLKMEESQTAIVRLKRGSFELNEEINLLLTVFSPDGKIIDEINTASDASFIIFNSEKKGDYEIIVRRWNGAAQGSYSIFLDYLQDRLESPTEQIDQLLSHFYGDNRPGASIRLSKGDEEIYSGDFGLANLESGQPITNDTRFDIASVSKQIAAYSIALLAVRGELDINRNIREYIPELPEYGNNISSLILVLNLSGIRDYDQVLALSGYDEEEGDRVNSQRVLNSILVHEDTYFQPGTDYRYSNAGYFLITEIVARVTGQSYASWVKENIFEPLEMTNTYVREETSKTQVNGSDSYKKDGLYDDISVTKDIYNEQPKNLEIFTVQSTSEDYAKWLKNYATGELGGAPVLELIETGIHDDPDSWNWAFGFQKTKYRDKPQKLSTGIIQGYRTHASYFPEEDLSLVYFANDGEWRTFYLANKILDIALETEPLAGEWESSYSADNDTFSSQDEESVDSNLSISKEIQGVYLNSNLSQTLEIKMIEDELIIKRFGYEPLVLDQVSENEFKSEKWYMSRIEFIEENQSSQASCKLYSSRTGDFIEFRKLKE
ncbi:MAG: serine hydrolase domain-containing protein [Bacteroidota bacterium]